jgi:predicted enzyme related to lactoylglutathione lyase
MSNSHGCFVWYELMTTDVEAAKAFYVKVIGWRARDASMPNLSYTLFTVGEAPAGGLIGLPQDAKKLGAAPRWIGYVSVDDVDATVNRVKELGGALHVPPTDIPNVSRFSVVADPQMARFILVKWSGSPRQQPIDLDEIGRVGWHELLAADRERAFAFYREIFGWQKAATEIGPTDTYQQFSAAGQTIGGMFNKPRTAPVAFWLYYFNVADVGAAAERVKSAGGTILEGPTDVPGGGRVARCMDPQGAMFALIGKRSDKAIGYFERNASSDSSVRRRWSW